MRARRSYDVNNVEKGRIAERDESYRSCIQALIIFFLICVTLIFISYFLKKENNSQNHLTNVESTKIKPSAKKSSDQELQGIRFTTDISKTNFENCFHGRVELHGNKLTTTTGKSATLTTENKTSNITITSISVPDTSVMTNARTEATIGTKMVSTLISTAMELETATSNELINNITQNTNSVQNKNNLSSIDDDFTVTNNLGTMSGNYEITVQPVVSRTYTGTTAKAEDENTSLFSIYTDITQFQFHHRSTFETDATEKINTEMTITQFDRTSINENDITELINETSQLSSSTLRTDEITLDVSETSSLASSVGSSENYNLISDLSTIHTMEQTDTDITVNYVAKSTSPTDSSTEINNTEESIYHEYLKNFTMSPNIVEKQPIKLLSKNSAISQTCTSARCKHTASKMLLYMNHSADPCDDFYEYACGGLEADSQILERDLNDRTYQRILWQIRKSHNKSTVFAMYYNSCINYDTVVSMSQRIKLAKKQLSEIGTFYTEDNHPDNLTDFTKLFAQLILNNGAILFDIVPDLEDVYNPKQYTLRIGPPMPEKLLDDGKLDDYCYNIHESNMQSMHVDLGELYTKYRKCKSDTKRYFQFTSEALRMLGVFEEHNSSEYIHQTLAYIDSEIMNGYFLNYPAADTIRKAYLTNNYKKVTLKELNTACTLVNWTKLIHSLTGLDIDPSATLYVYFYEQVFNGLKKLEEFSRRNGGWRLNNVLLGLYARDLYNQLVIPRHPHSTASCLRIASNILPASASSIYMSSFSNQELCYMNRTIYNLFNELKKTLKLNVESIEWADDKGRKELLKKITDIKLFVPDIEYFSYGHAKYEEKAVYGIRLSNNYFLNSIALLRKYRSLKYEGVKTEEVGSQQIWTYYATPFQTKGVSIYGLNCVIVPFGAIDWSILPEKPESSFDYLVIATLGNLVAYQIAHHFDANGINYWNGVRNSNNSVLFGSEFTSTNFEDYIACQRYYAYQDAVTLKLPFTDQTVSFQISQLTLNERLSEVVGLRLAYDTLIRLKAEKTVTLLPWLEFNVKQMFYLAYAQIYCTKTPLTSSYVSVYEKEQLPSRIRIFVSVSNNEPFNDVWGCNTKLQNVPNQSCSVFPYLPLRESIIIME